MPTDFAAMVHPATQELRNRFAAKLNFPIRCKILALARLGYPASVIARIYDLHPKTVMVMNRDQSPHYRKVRAEFNAMGAASFNEKYLKEEDLISANKVVAQLTNQSAPNKDVAPVAKSDEPNKIASQLAGDHMHMGRKINIRWIEESGETKAGWYYFDYLDDAEVGPYKTSKAALQAARSDIEIMLGD